MAREIVIEEAVCRHAEQNGWFVRKLTFPGRRGAPDRLFAKGGVVIFPEFKRPGCQPDALQSREHARMRAAGLRVEVIDSIEVGCALFD